MPARTGRAAAEELYRVLSRVAGCVTRQHLYLAGRRQGSRHQILFAGVRYTPLHGADRLMLRLSHDYEIEATVETGGWWRAKTAGYIYELSTRSGEAILGFHWHPSENPLGALPHLHVYGRTEPVNLRKTHLPTGLVTLPAVVRMTIRELGVEPLQPEWAKILDWAEGELP